MQLCEGEGSKYRAGGGEEVGGIFTHLVVVLWIQSDSQRNNASGWNIDP